MIDITKKYKTQDGRPVRLLCTDGPAPLFTVIGIIEGETAVKYWAPDGKFHPNKSMSFLDLIEDKPKLRVERWVNILQNKYGEVWIYVLPDRAEAEKCTHEDLVIARAIPFVWEEGEES